MLTQAKKHLNQMDLSYVCDKMCSPHYELPRWPVELIDTLEMLYKRFLWLHIKFPGEMIVPTRDIDEFWHNHILFTKHYTSDCEKLFGHYLHHTPSDPRDEKEKPALLAGFSRTKTLYQQEFGEPLKVLQR